ncbi:MAG TPA: hypothetical protein VEB21_08480 [Terriglobales bacterium]|nr:hypothetical protein [Terriglobales bacterium]
MPLHDLGTVIGAYSGLARKALDYTETMKNLVDAAKAPDFSSEQWDDLAAFVDTAAFERVGNFKEVMAWPEYVGFLDGWARSSEWECSFKRLTQNDHLVIVELEERSNVGGVTSAVNSVLVYEFDEVGKIRHLDIYLQMPLPELEMLKSYEGITIAQ